MCQNKNALLKGEDVISETLFSSRSEDWATPQGLFDKLDRFFDFQLDVCASKDNHKCHQYFSIQEDGLSQKWSSYKRIWMNPPYGKGIEKWMQKAYCEAQEGAIIVCLVPARTDTRWWHNWVNGKAHVHFIKGRLKYGNAKRSAPFPSAIIVYGIDINAML